jgi:hypothetical protein
MAELHVQKKRSSPLPWILLALLILGIVGYLVWRNSNKAETVPGTNDTITTQTVPPAGDTINRVP